jgi:uncharacterized protein (DUF2267 family)
MLLINIVWRQRERKPPKEVTEKMTKRKFIEQVSRKFAKMDIAFNIYETPSGNVIIALPHNFRRHEIKQINTIIEKVYNKIWKEHKPEWTYILLHGPKANKERRSTLLTSKVLFL